MTEVNFCPFCNASDHKLLLIDEKKQFCKECDKFFLLEEVKLKCMKCNKTNITLSEFPGANGELIFQCKSCKKMFSMKSLFEYNKD